MRAVSILILLVPALQTEVASAEPADIRFNEHVRPVLSEHCFACHGPDEKERKAGLRLDSSAGAQADLSLRISPGW